MKPSELLDDESKWTRNEFARDAQGLPVLVARPEAVRWCVVGACMRCDLWESRVDRLLRAAIISELAGADQNKTTVCQFNDNLSTTFDQVRRVLLAAGL